MLIGFAKMSICICDDNAYILRISSWISQKLFSMSNISAHLYTINKIVRADAVRKRLRHELRILYSQNMYKFELKKIYNGYDGNIWNAYLYIMHWVMSTVYLSKHMWQKDVPKISKEKWCALKIVGFMLCVCLI